MSKTLTTVISAVALMALSSAPNARPAVGVYLCSGSQGSDLMLEVLEEGCAIDGELGAEAESTPLQCHSPPPVIRNLVMFDDMTYSYDPGNSGFNADAEEETVDTTTVDEKHAGVCNPV